MYSSILLDSLIKFKHIVVCIKLLTNKTIQFNVSRRLNLIKKPNGLHLNLSLFIRKKKKKKVERENYPTLSLGTFGLTISPAYTNGYPFFSSLYGVTLWP